MGEAGGDVDLAGRGGPDRRDHLVWRIALARERGDADLERARDSRLVAVVAERDQGWFRTGAPHLRDVGQVDDEHVRFRLGDERSHHRKIGDVSDDLDLAAAVEDGTQAFAEEPLIVDDDDANQHGALET